MFLSHILTFSSFSYTIKCYILKENILLLLFASFATAEIFAKTYVNDCFGIRNRWLIMAQNGENVKFKIYPRKI